MLAGVDSTTRRRPEATMTCDTLPAGAAPLTETT